MIKFLRRFSLPIALCLTALLMAVILYIYIYFGKQALLLAEATTVGVWLAALIIAKPELGALLILFALPFERVPSVDVAGVSIKANIILGAITALSTLIAIMFRRQRLRINATHVLILLVLVVQLLSLAHAVELTRAIKTVGFTAFVFGFSWLIPQWIVSQSLLRTAVRILILVAAIVGVFGIYQFVGDVIGLPRSLTLIDQGFSKIVFGFPRIHAFSLEPLYLGNYLLLPFSLLFSLLLVGVRTRLSHIWFWGLFVLLGIVLVLTVSRGAYLAAAVSVLVIMVSLPRETLKPRHLLIGLGIIVAVLGASFIFLMRSNSAALGNFQNHVLLGDFANSGSGAGRLSTFTQAIEIWKVHPWLGVGPGNFGPASFNFPNPIINPASAIVNNEYLELLAETGLIGLFAVLLVFGSVILRSIVALRQAKEPLLRAVLIGGTAGFIGMLVQYNFFSTLYIIHIWSTVGFLLAAQTIALRSGSKSLVESPL